MVVGGRHPALGRGALVKGTVLCLPGENKQRQTEKLARGRSLPDTSALDQPWLPKETGSIWGKAEMRRKPMLTANRG